VLTITLPLPPGNASPNARCHWAAKHRARSKQRQDAYLATLDAIQRQKPEGLPWASATLQATFFFRVHRTRDADNLIASCIGFQNGIADSGVVVNDSQFVPLPPKIEVDRDDPRVEIEIKEMASGPVV